MTPIYFKQRGAQIVLRADSIRVIVCRSIKADKAKRYIPEGWEQACWQDGLNKVLYTKGRYYFIHEEATNLIHIDNIDSYINQVVECTNHYINYYL